MRGGVIGGLCFLAFLYSIVKAEEQAASDDLTAGDNLKVIDDTTSALESENEERSGAFAESSASSSGGSTKSDAMAGVSGGLSSISQSQASSGSSYGVSAQSKSEASLDVDAISLSPGYNRGYPYRVPGSKSVQASAEAQASSLPPAGTFQANGMLMPSLYSTGPMVPISLISGGPSLEENDAQVTAGSTTVIKNGQGPANVQAFRDPTSNRQKIHSPYGQSPYQVDSSANALSENSYNPLSGVLYPFRTTSQAQAQSDTLGGWGNPYNPINSPYNSGSNSAHSQAAVQTNIAGNTFIPYSPYIPYGLSSSSQAQSETSAQSSGGFNAPYNTGLSPYAPAPYNSGSNSASAQATSNSGVNSPYNSGPYYFSNPASNTASVKANGISNIGGNSLYNPTTFFPSGFPLSPKGGSSQAIAEALAPTSVGANLYGQGLQPSGYYSPGLQVPAQLEASAEAMANSASSPASQFAEVNSRVIQPYEYIYPNNVPGEENLVHCTRLYEMWYVKSPKRECMVCTCVQDSHGYLSPMCALCSGCQSPPSQFPEQQPGPEVIPFPEPYPVVPTPPPSTSEVTCSPLLSGNLFTNPLNPCQVCVCREIVNALGKPDVKIDCQDNPQCVIPPDVTTMPSLPDIPIPIPLPLCDKFPPNVLFPHPSDSCKMCKCSLEQSENGISEQQITCYPTPGCVPRPNPVPEPVVTLPPVAFPLTYYPTPPPFPDLVTSEPIMPWPPATTLAPPSPGPLPGPSPHESCRPFPPNQPFQHPWDECQVCVCSEATAIGLITVEVNCYTKKSCCIESEDAPATLPPPTPYPVPGKIIIKDSVCEFKTFGVEFPDPDDNCQVCVCALLNGVVSSSCERSLAPECQTYTYGNVLTEAPASSNTAIGLPFGGNSGYSPTPFLPISQYAAHTNAISSSPQSVYLPGQYQMIQPNLNPSQADSQSQASIQTQGYGQLSSSADAEANQIGFVPVLYQPDRPTTYPSQGETQSQAQTLSEAQALFGYGQTNALANAQETSAIYNRPISLNYPYTIQPSAESVSQIQNIRYKYPNYGRFDSKAQSLADAIMRLNRNKFWYGQGVPASVYYPSMYTRPSYEIAPLYQPGQFMDTPQAQSLASGLNVQSQAAASALSGGMPLTKSGNPEDIGR